MVEFKKKGYYGSKAINPDEYLDMSIKSIIDLPNELKEEGANFDVPKYLRMKAILTEQLENLAVGLNKIKSVKREYAVSELNVNEKNLRIALIDFFRKENPKINVGANPKADAVMRFIVEGPYSTVINLKKDSLDKKVKEGKVDEDTANAQLSNLKLQLIIRAIQNSKVKSVEIDV